MSVVLFQAAKAAAFYKCPYCGHTNGTRDGIFNHMGKEHVHMLDVERDHLEDPEDSPHNVTSIRLENLNKRGTRVISKSRVYRHTLDLRRFAKGHPNEYDILTELDSMMYRIVAECNTAVGDEDQIVFNEKTHKEWVTHKLYDVGLYNPHTAENVLMNDPKYKFKPE